MRRAAARLAAARAAAWLVPRELAGADFERAMSMLRDALGRTPGHLRLLLVLADVLGRHGESELAWVAHPGHRADQCGAAASRRRTELRDASRRCLELWLPLDSANEHGRIERLVRLRDGETSQIVRGDALANLDDDEHAAWSDLWARVDAAIEALGGR